MARSLRILLAFVTFSISSTSGVWYNEIFSPATVTDSYNNEADADSNITWAPIPAGEPYEDVSAYDDGGLAALINLAKSFINTVQPLDEDFMTELYQNMYDGEFGFITDDIVGFVMKFVGIIVCIVIAFLYIIFVPLVGIFFCACRCCCRKCGGNMKQKRGKHDTCCCFTYTIIVTIVTIFMAAGGFCTYSAGNQLTTSFDTITRVSSDNLANIETFINNTVDEIQYIASTNFNFTAQVIERDLDNIGILVGGPVRTELETTGGINAVISSIVSLDNTVQTIGSDILAVNASIASLTSLANVLSDDLSNVKADIDAAQADASCTGCSVDTSSLTMDFDPSSLPDISAEVDQVVDVMATNLTELALEAKAGVDEIPEIVHNETLTIVSDIKTMLDDFITTVDDALDGLNGLPDSVAEQTSEFDGNIDDIVDSISDYDSYRVYVGVGFASITILVVLFQTLGLIFGCLCFRKSSIPTDRNCGSNCGGIFLMVAVAMIFCLSWLLMLLTMVLFIIGTPMQVYFCGPMTDPDLSMVHDLLDTPGVVFDDYPMADAFYGDGTIPLTISGTLLGCKANGAMWSVLLMDNYEEFNLTEVTNYRSDIDLDTELDGINVDLSSIEVISQETEDSLTDFKAAVNIDFQGFVDQLEADTTSANLTALAEAVRAAAASASDPSQTDLYTAADDLDTIQATSYPAVVTAQAQLLADILTLNASVSTVNDTVDDVLDAGNVVDTYLSVNGSAMITDEVENYAERLFGVIDSYVDNVIDSINDDIGQCRPVYDVFNSLVDTAVCKATIETLNAFWLSIGWSLLFMFLSLIFNVKLAKYFRKMKYCEGYDNIPQSVKMTPYPTGYQNGAYPRGNGPGMGRGNGPGMGSGNKIGHMDY